MQVRVRFWFQLTKLFKECFRVYYAPKEGTLQRVHFFLLRIHFV